MNSIDQIAGRTAITLPLNLAPPAKATFSHRHFSLIDSDLALPIQSAAVHSDSRLIRRGAKNDIFSIRKNKNWLRFVPYAKRPRAAGQYRNGFVFSSSAMTAIAMNRIDLPKSWFHFPKKPWLV
jgi:hypothetical protein